MATIYIPSPLRKFSDGKKDFLSTENTVNNNLNELFKTYPELKEHILDETGEVRSFVNLYLGSENINELDGVETRTNDESKIRIIPAIAGGNNAVKLNVKEYSRYSRHLTLPEIGVKGQEKLKNSSVLVIGCGGLGNPVSLYLTAAGVGKIGLVDFDIVDESNLQRQILFGVDNVGEPKVMIAKERLNNLNPNIEIITYEEKLTSENAMEIVADYDIVIDGTDNFNTRYLVNDVCVLLNKINVYGSIFRFDGQASVFNYNNGPCYRCLYPEPPPPGLVPSCAEGGVLGVLPGIIGCIQATEAIKIITGSGTSLSGRFLLFDALNMEFNELSIKKNDNCLICSDDPQITELIDYEEFCGIGKEQVNESIEEISVTRLKDQLQYSNITLLDVREPFELEIANISGAIHIPMAEVPSRIDELSKIDEIVVMCKTGIRSAKICDILLKSDFKKVKNLRGGIKAWSEEIDNSVPVY